jgi:hypothetical protein
MIPFTSGSWGVLDGPPSLQRHTLLRAVSFDQQVIGVDFGTTQIMGAAEQPPRLLAIQYQLWYHSGDNVSSPQ